MRKPPEWKKSSQEYRIFQQMKTTYAITVAKCPPDEGGKSCDHLSTNHKAANCITECNDREGAKLVKSVTECQSSEFEVSSIYYNQKSNFPMASINLKKINQFFLRRGGGREIGGGNNGIKRGVMQHSQFNSIAIWGGGYFTGVSGECGHIS